MPLNSSVPHGFPISLVPGPSPDGLDAHIEKAEAEDRLLGALTHQVTIDGHRLSLEDVVRVAKDGARVMLSPDALTRVMEARALVESVVSAGSPVYGINTGFGRLASITIPSDSLQRLQVNLVRSHVCGVGSPLSREEVRAVMLLRANVLANGHSGVRPIIIETLIKMLNHGVHPVVPEKGSVGASGDLAPLAHIAQVIIGEGEAEFQDHVLPGMEAMTLAGIEPVLLEAKEGLSLINGTQVLAAVGALALSNLEKLANIADVSGAMSLEALHGKTDAFDEQIHLARPYPGQIKAAESLRALTVGSQLLRSERSSLRVQDAYSLRCMPQVHGAARDALAHVKLLLEIEFNSGIDNPLVFADTGRILSGGNFHGAPLAMAFDYAAIAAAGLGSISERRIERLVNPDLSGLPAFLTVDPGTCSGFMIAHVTAAALCSENKVLSHPASVDSIPTSAGTEDHVSMGMSAAVKLRQVADNVATILSIELLTAAQALEFSVTSEAGDCVSRVFNYLRQTVPAVHEDVQLSPFIEAVKNCMWAIPAVAAL